MQAPVVPPVNPSGGRPLDVGQIPVRPVMKIVVRMHSLLEGKVMAEDYRQHYNTYRPHPSFDYRTPNEFKIDWNSNSPLLTKTLVH